VIYRIRSLHKSIISINSEIRILQFVYDLRTAARSAATKRALREIELPTSIVRSSKKRVLGTLRSSASSIRSNPFHLQLKEEVEAYEHG
jgi:hypothetical protein